MNDKKTEKLVSALAKDQESATFVVFSANTNKAGFSKSARGAASSLDNPIKKNSASFVRQTDFLFPSLSENMDSSELLFDKGCLEVPDQKEEQIRTVTKATDQIIENGKVPIILGGDHLVKYSLMQSLIAKKPNTGVIYIDAHPDTDATKELYYGSILYHAVKGLGYAPENILILGLRQCNTREAMGLKELGVKYILASEFELNPPEEISSRILKHFSHVKEIAVSIDLDAFDPSVAPAVEAPYPGGLTLLRVKTTLESVLQKHPLAAMDISEFLVEQDPAHLTALLSCYLLRELTKTPTLSV